MNNTKFGIFIIHYKNWDDTIACYNSCLDQVKSYDNCQIFVVDNDDYKTQSDLAKDIVILTPNNIGYAGGINYGIQKHINDFDYSLCLNNDLILEQNALTKFEQQITKDINNNNNVALYSTSTYEMEDTKHLNPTTTGTLNRITGKVKDSQSFDEDKFDYVNGAVLLLNNKYLRQYGLLSEDYFLYFEENDLCLQIRKNSWSVKYIKDLYVYHKGSGSVGKKSLIQDYYTTRNILLLAKKFFPYNLITILPFIFFNNYLPKLMLFKFERSQYVLNGILDFFKNKKGKIKIN
jgi:GT2 family glycosyltransferase